MISTVDIDKEITECRERLKKLEETRKQHAEQEAKKSRSAFVAALHAELASDVQMNALPGATIRFSLVGYIDELNKFDPASGLKFKYSRDGGIECCKKEGAEHCSVPSVSSVITPAALPNARPSTSLYSNSRRCALFVSPLPAIQKRRTLENDDDSTSEVVPKRKYTFHTRRKAGTA